MKTERLTRKAIDLQRSTVDMMLNTMSNIQEQSGKAAHAYFEQMSGIPREGLKFMDNWMNQVRQTREEFNSAVKEGFDNWSNIVGRTAEKADESFRQSQTYQE